LHRALIEECLLYGMQAVALGETFYRRNFLLANVTHVGNAGSPRLAIDQDGAGATLAFAASIFTSGQIQMISQHHQKTSICIRIDGVGMSINIELSSCCHPETSCAVRASWIRSPV
jgi:hypothetical protein